MSAAEDPNVESEEDLDLLRVASELHGNVRSVKPLIETFSHYATVITLFLVLCGLVWALATWRAEFDAVQMSLQELRGAVRAQDQALDSIARDVSFMAGRQAERDQAAQQQP